MSMFLHVPLGTTHWPMNGVTWPQWVLLEVTLAPLCPTVAYIVWVGMTAFITWILSRSSIQVLTGGTAFMECRWEDLQWVLPHFLYLFINKLHTWIDVFYKEVCCHYMHQLLQYHRTCTLQVYAIFCRHNILNSMPQVYWASVSSGNFLVILYFAKKFLT